MEELGELGGQFGAYFFALEGAGCCEDGYLGHGGGEIDGSGLAFEVGGRFYVGACFVGDEGDIGF